MNLFKILAKRRALNQAGHLLNSPVGNQQYLSSVIPFTHRVINKVAIEMGPFLVHVSLLLKKVMERGEGGLFKRSLFAILA